MRNECIYIDGHVKSAEANVVTKIGALYTKKN